MRRVEDGRVWVDARARSSCGRCASKGGCSTVTLSRLFCASPRLFSLSTNLNLNVGDVVIIGMDERLILKSALTAYALPPAALLAGAWLGRHLGAPASDAVSIATGFAAFCLSVVAVKVWGRRLHRLGARPSVLRRVPGTIVVSRT